MPSMPRYSFVALCCLVGVFVTGSRVSSGQTTPPTQAMRHVVVFKYTPEATAAQIQVITDAFRALTTTIPGIVAFPYHPAGTKWKSADTSWTPTTLTTPPTSSS